MTSLDDLLSPNSIAVVGASNDPTRIGGRPLSHMIAQKFEGGIYAVNPKRETVQGLPAYSSLTDIADDLDFVIVAVPAKLVAEQVRLAAAKKARTVMVFSSGFAELGDEGIALQAELAQIATETGVRLIGPNCLGAFNAKRRFYPTFSSTIDRATPNPGGTAIASQSGAYGSHIYMAAHQRGLGIGYWLTTGNEADVSVAEAIHLMAEHDDAHTIIAYSESIKDGSVWVEALEAARANRKPVVFIKVGRSAVGAAAASSHTASLAGEDAVFDAVLRQHGAWRAKTTEELIDIAVAARPRIYPVGRKLGIVTISGGAGVLMADDAEDEGLDVAPMPEDAQEALKTLLPFASPRNPVDVTAQFFNDLSLIPQFTRAMLDRGGYDALIGFWTSVAGSPVLGGPLLDYLKDTMADYPDRLFLHVMLAPEKMVRQYDDAGFPNFEDPTRAVRALAALIHFGANFAKGRTPLPDVPHATDLGAGSLNEREAKLILSQSGFNVEPSELVTSAEEAGGSAVTFGCPVAMKIASPDIPHKTEVGGVALGIEGAEAAKGTFDRLMASVRSKAPDARIDGVLISPMINDGIDCILGAKLDPVFGPIVLFGLGGIFTEIMNDVAFRRAPFDVETAREMIDELRGSALLTGARGKPAMDLDTLAVTISKLSLFAAANIDHVESVEINPLRAHAKGCIALDALIVRTDET